MFLDITYIHMVQIHTCFLQYVHIYNMHICISFLRVDANHCFLTCLGYCDRLGWARLSWAMLGWCSHEHFLNQG